MKLVIFNKKINIFAVFLFGILWSVLCCSLLCGSLDMSKLKENVEEGFFQQTKKCNNCGCKDKGKKLPYDKNIFSNYQLLS